jgi:hypothetical protein
MNQINIDAIAQAIVSALSSDEVDVVEAPAPATPAALTRAQKREANQKRNREINGQLSNATKAFNRGDATACVEALENAAALVPTHLSKDGTLAWQGTLDRVHAKGKSLAEKAALAAAEAVVTA